MDDKIALLYCLCLDLNYRDWTEEAFDYYCGLYIRNDITNDGEVIGLIEEELNE